MKDEVNSMAESEVWEVVQLFWEYRLFECKWICKTKLEYNRNIERHKAWLVAKGFNQKEGID